MADTANEPASTAPSEPALTPKFSTEPIRAGSAAVMVCAVPPSRTLPRLSPAATPTEGSRPRPAASSGLNPASPALPP